LAVGVIPRWAGTSNGSPKACRRRFSCDADAELRLRHGVERAEVRVPGRAHDRVEAADLLVHGPHRVGRADVDPHRPRAPAGDHDLVPARQRRDRSPADRACASHDDDAHAAVLSFAGTMVIVRLAVGDRIKGMGVHEPNVASLTAGANAIYAETGPNPLSCGTPAVHPRPA
jgi:hypothetical protein